MRTTVLQLRYALRQLRKSPGFSITVLLTLALSIGANTAVFSVVNALLLRPLPYPHPEQLATLEVSSSQGVLDPLAGVDGETWDAIRDSVPAVRAAVSDIGGPVRQGVNIRTPEGVQYVSAARVSAGFLDVLSVRPMLGRNFNAGEDTPGGPRAAILSYDFWHTAFHDDRNVLGRAILIKGEPYSIVGVLPEGAVIPSAPNVLTPIRPTRTGEGEGDNYGLIARLEHGGWQQANAQLAHVHSQSLAYHGSVHSAAAPVYRFVPLQKGFTAEERGPVLTLMLATSLILLIACANLAGLALVRVNRRAREIATRMALGATRWTVIRQLWAENLVIASIGGAAGLLTGQLLLRALAARVREEILPAGGLHLDARVLAFTILATLATSVLFGMLPALHARDFDLRSTMSAGIHAHPGGRRVRLWLIGGEVALTVVLLASAGLLVRTLAYLQGLPPGFNAAHVMTAKASLDEARYRDPSNFSNLLAKSAAALVRIPGVQSAAVGLSLPYERGLNDSVTVKDGPGIGQMHGSGALYITPDYFSTLGIRVLDGRAFTSSDTAQSEPVVIVNQSFAREMLHSAHPLGRHIRIGRSVARVVGVVADVEKTPGLSSGAPLSTERTMYTPATQVDAQSLAVMHIWFQPSWIVRTRGAIPSLTLSMQQALASVDPNLPFSGFSSMDSILAKALDQQRIEVALLSAIAALALLLSAIGIFGLVANTVAQRRREIGIRLALGSSTRAAVVVAGRSGMTAAVYGVVAGLVGSLAALRGLRSALYGVRSYDPLTLMATGALLLAVALFAATIPALRAAKINPAETLREE
ncbi:MAG: ABC transporter permease [Acidobacteriaceae bacterium]